MSLSRIYKRTPLDVVAPTLLLLDGVIGMAANGALLVVLCKESMTSFSVVCWVRAFVNFALLFLVFVVDNTPAALLGSSLLPESVESVIYNVVLLVYMINQVMSLFIAVNRCTAVFFPLHYNRIFRLSLTVIFMAVIYLYTIGAAVSRFIEKEKRNPPCRLLFSGEEMTWMAVPPELCSEDFGSMLTVGLTFGSLLLVVNFITFARIIHFQYVQNGDHQSSNEKVRANILLWFQTILQDLLYTTDFIFTAILGSLINERWWVFLSYTFVWENVLTLDGIIMMVFSAPAKPIRGRLRSFFSGKPKKPFQMQTISGRWKPMNISGVYERTALDLLAPVLIFVDGLIGIVANGALLVVLCKETMTSFSVVCWIRAFVNLVILLLVFVVDNAPAALL
ncbi:unnamed protein product [Caenorhabditis auriculariae]|uniref:G-protein coupled receptors family 1 profile domain-containing protein n=1 Tax=Caenorhabditis auriculariae TaxID=2777116 RepID=A0A8S1H5A7_9PELO|nr:unnamed protein product [Caenorhabditis auriculariae]